MSTDRRAWRSTLRAGLVWGVGVVFLALVGLLEAVSQRQIVVGVISLSYAFLAVMALAAGFQTSRRLANSGPAAIVLGGTVVGGVMGACVGVLVAIGRSVNLRAVIVGATPTLYELLSFGRGTAGVLWLVLGGAVIGGLGAVTTFLPTRWRRPFIAGLGMVFVIGLFQELVQLMLQSEVRATIRDVFFTQDGLSVRGAVLVFLIAVGINVVWSRYRGSVGGWAGRLPPPRRRALRVVGVVLAVVAVLLLPLVAGPFLSQVLVIVGLYTLMGLGLNLEVGFAGLLDLGFVAFFAIGAYTVGLLTTTGPLAIAHLSFWAAVPIAVVVTLVAGVIFGLPILGIRGDYLAIATLGFGEITRLVVLSDFLRPWLGGSQGVLGIPKPTLGGFEFAGPEQIFYLTLASSALVAFVGARLLDSRLGRAWMALREDEDVAEAMGINLVNVKLLAYGIGAAFAGVSGAIFGVMVSSVFPHSFSILISINVLALIIVGGMGSQPGVVVGALVLVGLPELLREFSDFRFLVYGAVLVLMMQFRPEGLWPAAAIRRELHEEIADVTLPRETVELAEAKEPQP